MARENRALAFPSADRPAQAERTSVPHNFKFFRAGGLDQVALETAEDLLALETLDPKLWVALSCPTRGLELDARTLELLDLDRDGRVRVPEVLAAIRFCAERLRDVGVLLRGADALAIEEIRDDTTEGQAARGAARFVLAQAGRPDAEVVLPGDVADAAKIFAGTLLNGDGVVPAEATSDLEARQALLDILATLGGLPDRGGKLGVDRARIADFFAEVEAFAAWRQKGESSPEVMVLGDRTAAAWEAIRAVRAKVDDFFVRCRFAAMEPRATQVLNRTEPEFAALGARDLSAGSPEIAAFPIARVEPGGALPLVAGLNPAWAAAVAALRREVVVPLVGEEVTALDAETWAALLRRFAAHEAWLGAKAGAKVEPLGPARVRALLAGGARTALEALVARDEALARDVEAVTDLTRLVLYHRDLGTLLRNFVSFADLYDPARRAVFQAGTLFLDARSCALCVRVDDPGAHAALASLSRMYVAYCDCRRPGGESMKIAACFTQGDADYLVVGRNGVFYDRRGRDWDATIVKLLENPISLRQAFFAPYRKALRLVEEQVARFAQSRQKAADEQLERSTAAAGDAAAAGTPAPVGALDVGKTVGIVAALGVGIGALGTLLGAFVSGFMGLSPWWAKLVAIAGVVLFISGPSVLIAWLKLRQRTLGPLLDATGWAVNGRVRVNVPLGTALTDRAVLPEGARRMLEDPYADRAARRRRRIASLLVACAVAALVAARVLGQWPFGPLSWPR